MGIPLREYYPIDRAAELLGCKEDDILHWAGVGAIKLYISFEYGHGYVHLASENDNSLQKIEDEYQYVGVARDGFSIISNIINTEDYKLVEFFDKPAPWSISHPCIFSGFWSIPYTAFKNGLLYSFTPTVHDLWKSTGDLLFISVETNDEITFDKDNLFIMSSDFIKIKNNSMGDIELPSISNGRIHNESVIDKVESANKKRSDSKGRYWAEIHLKIIRAAVLYKESNKEVFDKECRNKKGKYIFTQWAKKVIDEEYKLFEDKKCPLESEKAVMNCIKSIFKL